MSAAAWAERLNGLAIRSWPRLVEASDLQALMGDTSGVEGPLLEARAQKAALVWAKQRVAADPSFGGLFPDKTGIAWFDKLLTIARLQELRAVRIVKAGKSSGLRYDIGGLACTWYGRKVLDGLGLSRRRSSATKEEYEQIVRAFARIKLTLPQSVEPTTTERYFAGELD